MSSTRVFDDYRKSTGGVIIAVFKRPEDTQESPVLGHNLESCKTILTKEGKTDPPKSEIQKALAKWPVSAKGLQLF